VLEMGENREADSDSTMELSDFERVAEKEMARKATIANENYRIFAENNRVGFC
jgi:hypothetical protein